MRNAVARTRTAHPVARPTRPGQAGRSNHALFASALVALIAASVGLFLLTRPGAGGSAAGSEHSLGVATAPVVVEEWSDFE
jgi:hypothetical protein